MVCFALAAYYGITQVVRYVDNKSSSTIAHKIFNEEPNNKYPTFSICLKGKEIYWRNEHYLFEQTGMTSSQYVELLEGKGWKYDYNEANHLYKKEYTNESTIRNHDAHRVFLDPSDVIVGTHFFAEYDHQSSHFGYGVEKVNLKEIPFQIGHQLPDETCFTRSSSDETGLIRVRDEVLLNASLLDLGNHLSLAVKLILHYPGQLIDKIETPHHQLILNEMRSNGNSNKMLWEGKVVKVSVLKDRPDANPPCYDGDVSEDSRFRQEVLNQMGCVPIYWKSFEAG